VLRVSKSVELTETDDGAFLLDTARGIYWHLNWVGVQVIQGIQNGLKISEISSLVASECDADDETVQADIIQLLKKLKKARLVRKEFP
jgi:hypothetical protein